MTIERKGKLRHVRASKVAPLWSDHENLIALLIQALLERQLRKQLSQQGAPPLKLYPKDCDAPHPTTSQLFKTFDRLSTKQGGDKRERKFHRIISTGKQCWHGQSPAARD